MVVLAEGAEVGDDIVDLLVGEEVAEGGHDLRKAEAAAAVKDDGFIGGVGLGCGLVAAAHVRPGVGTCKDSGSFGRAFAVCAMTGDAAVVPYGFAMFKVGMLRRDDHALAGSLRGHASEKNEHAKGGQRECSCSDLAAATVHGCGSCLVSKISSVRKLF